MSLKDSNFPFPDLLKRLSPTAPEICLYKNQNTERWDSWGVRDVAILCDEAGSFIADSNEMYMYYTGSCSEGKIQQTGRAVSKNNGKNWIKEPLTPVLGISTNEWDSSVSATPWVIKLESTYHLFYRGSRNASFSDAIGLATSNDGIHFKKYCGNPIIKPEDFAGIRSQPSCMGVLNAVQDYDGNLIVLFEAVEEYNQQRGQIFAATSSDGINFEPINGGMPIFSSRDVNSWPVLGVCNPRLIRLGKGWYMLGFNGSHSGEWSIGFAFTKNLIDWFEHPSNPIIVPRGWPAVDPLSGRVEGPCVHIDSMQKKATQMECYFMTIPFGSDNHCNGAIAKTLLELSPNRTSAKYDFVGLPSSKQSYQLLEDDFSLDATVEKSKFLQVHHVAKGLIKRISMELSLDRNENPSGKIYIVLSNTLNSLPKGIGTTIRISDNYVDFREDSQFANGKEHAPLKHWKPIVKLPRAEDKITFQLIISKGSMEVTIQNNGESFPFKTNISNGEYRILTCVCYMTSALFRFNVIE